MEKQIMVEFFKIIGIGIFKFCMYTLSILALYYAYLFAGFPSEESIMYGSFTVLATVFIYFGVDMAWHRAKINVKYRDNQ